MIQRNSYLNAVQTAKNLEDRKIALSASQSSVLGELMDLSCSVTTTVANTTLARTVTANTSANAIRVTTPEDRACEVGYTTGNHDGPSQHSLKVQALADEIAPFVASHISFARNVVAPLVDGYANKLAKFMETARPLDPVSMFDIRQKEIPEILLDESFMAGGLEQYANIDATHIPFPKAIEGGADDAFYASLSNVGNERQNALVGKWLATLPPNFIRNLYLDTFVIYEETSPERGAGEYLGEYIGDPGRHNNPYDTIDHALGLYLIATRLMATVQSVKGMSLIAYKQKMRLVMDYTGAMVMRGLKAAIRQVSQNVLVSEAIISKRQVTVNAPVYQKWLAEGGCPEAILGMLASGNIQYNVAGVNEAKETLIRQWNNYVMISQASIKAEMHKRFMEYACAEAILMLNEPVALETEYCQDKPGIKDQIADKIKAELQKHAHNAMDDVRVTALHVIAEARFFYTSAFRILEQMMEVAKTNPNVDPREAALLSTHRYACEYLMAQILVKS